MESSTAEFVARQIACGRLPIITSLKAASRKARTWRDTHRLCLGLRRSASSHHFESWPRDVAAVNNPLSAPLQLRVNHGPSLRKGQ
jgi:hypothetical protein